MTVAYRSITSPVGTTSSTLSVDPPAGITAGDMMYMAIGANLDRNPTPPGDWTLEDSETGGNFNIHVYSKIAGGSESAYTVTQQNTENYCAGIVAFYSDAAHTLYTDAHANQANAASTDRTCPGVTTTKASAGLACFFNSGDVAGTTPASGMTERWDTLVNLGNQFYLMTSILTSSGATGDKVATGVLTLGTRCVTVAVAERLPPDGDPDNLTATAASDTQINLAWQDHASNETGYEIYHSTNGSSYSLLTTTAADATSYNHTSLTEHSLHYYKVRAVNDDGVSNYTSVASTTTNILAPSGLSAVANGTSEIDLSWTNNSGVYTSTKIERSATGSGSWSQIDTVSAGVTSYPNVSLNPDTTWFYRIRASVSSDNSAYTANASAITALSTPTSLTVTPLLSTKLHTAWLDSNGTIDNFELERSPNGTSSWSQVGTPTGTSFDNSSLTASTTYYYRVRAKHGTNYSAYSSVAHNTTYATLVAPTGLIAQGASPTSVQLSWQDSNAGVTGFSLERSPDDATWAEVATPSASPATDTGLSSGITYYYRLRTYRSGSVEYSSYSSETIITLSVTPKTMRLFLLQPVIVFQARINLPSGATYPLDTLPFDGVTTGAFGDVRTDQTVLIGSTSAGEDLGRTRVRAAPTSSNLYIGRSSQGTKDGEVTATDNAYLTVIDDFRVWDKTPFIGSNGVIFTDSSLVVSDRTSKPPPIANLGPGTAADIDPDSLILEVYFSGEPSIPVADGATITGYLWDVIDGTITVGSTTTSTITVDFPAGFRWVALTVTDSNGKTHTARCPVYARDPDDDLCIPAFQIESHRITPAGQQLQIHIRQDIDATNFLDGTLVLLWEGTPASSHDRSHMKFIGWHQNDSAQIQASRTATLRDTTLMCVDVAGRLNALPGFPWELDDADTPTDWVHMTDPNIDKYVHFILQWFSTALDLADWSWSGTGSDYSFVGLVTAGESLYDQAERKCRQMVPEYTFTCNRQGQLFMNPDPMLQDRGDRTGDVQATITESDWSEIRYTHQRPPRVHWLRSNAIQAGLSLPLQTLFCIAPGDTPGQGVNAENYGEQLAIDQDALNAATGHRYARMNAPENVFNITLVAGNPSDDSGINDLQPANMSWVRLTISSDTAAQRGLSFTEAKGLLKEVNIRYDHGRTGTVKQIELQWERETEGIAAATVVPDTADPVDDGDTWWPTPVTPDVPFDSGLVTGVNNIVMFDELGAIFRTNNFQNASPTWAELGLGISENVYSFVVDPFSPLYRSLGTEVNGWIITPDHIIRLTDLFGTAAKSTIYTFAHTAAYDNKHWRSVQASFGRYFSTETDNPWLMVASHYQADSGHTGTYIVYSVDAGVTWSSEILVTANYDSSIGASGREVQVGLYLSPKTPGLAYLSVFTTTASTATAATYYTSDWGATWAALADPSILPINRLAGTIHVPWPDNDDERLVYYGAYDETGNLAYTLQRAESGTTSDISPNDGTRNYGVNTYQFGVSTFDSDRTYVAMCGIGNDTSTFTSDDQAAAYVSSDNGDTWTEIFAPTAVGNAHPEHIAFGGDDHSILYMVGFKYYIGYSSNFGSSISDKTGNLAAVGGTGAFHLIGLCGG